MTEKEFLQSVGAKIRIARENKGLTLREVGKIIDIYYSHISLIEQGKSGARITTIKMLADIYEVEVKDFFK